MFFFGDDDVIHQIFESCDITVDDLPEFAKFLSKEFGRTGDSKIEQLEYAINFIFEARSNGYKVKYKTIYIDS